MTREVRVVSDEAALHVAAAVEIAAAVTAAVTARGSASLVLSGGSTPRGVYAALARADGLAAPVPWTRVHVFWGDERHVPPDHADSNFRMAQEALLAHVPVPADHVHRMAGELADPAAAAAQYAETIRAVVGPAEGTPRFDVVLLGLGADGHVASLFPHSTALDPEAPLVAAPFVRTQNTHRITMTLPLLNAAHAVIVLVSGAAKAEAVRDVLEPASSTPLLPARQVQPASGRLLWLLDRAAAGRLESPRS